MIRFFIKGLIRDRHRSLFPIIIGSTNKAFIKLTNAKDETGHMKIVTKSYSENSEQMPIDLSLVGVGELSETLQTTFPEIEWVERIRFGGLLDAPDENGETKSQGAAVGFAVDLFTEGSLEAERLNIPNSIVQGRLPERPGEIIISELFASKLEVGRGDVVTLLSSTMYGSMSMTNFTIVGTVQFGITVLDRGAMIVDITDAQIALDMEDAAAEILGYLPGRVYNDEEVMSMRQTFSERFPSGEDEFAPVMLSLKEQSFLGEYMDYVNSFSAIIAAVFIVAMSIVLWNVGLLGGLRRYGEIGVRLAIGEEKGQVYRAMLGESVIVGIVGSVIGTGIGLGLAFLLQTYGIDLSGVMQDIQMMVPTTFRAQIIPAAYYIGFIPGVASMLLGTALSGIGIYRRQTAQLFKELQA